MTLHAKPNGWVAVDDAQATTLTYAPRVDPAPLTVSVPNEDPTLGSLEVVITNATGDSVNVDEIDFTVQVGTGAALMATTADLEWTISDIDQWSVTGPQTNPAVTSGSVEFALTPVSGDYVTLAAGASLVLQIYDFQTIAVPATANVAIKETIDGQSPTFGAFSVTTFPAGFYFDSLVANVESGSTLVPVAQVAENATVTLTWNSSVVDTDAATVYFSSATQGQQTGSPSVLGEWTSVPLTSDTVFVVVITATGFGGQPLSVALATAVSVQNPALVASSVNAGQATISGQASIGGALSANAITATGVTVNGALTASSGTINGALAANSGTINGALTANGLTVNGALGTSGDVNPGGNVNASGTVNSNSGTGSLAALTGGGVSAGQITGSGGIWRSNVGDTNGVNAWNASQACTGYFNNAKPVSGYVGGVGAQVPGSGDCGLGTNGYVSSSSGSALVTHLETHAGHRVVTSPLCLAPEVQVSGHGRLSSGRAAIELDAHVADVIHHSGEQPYRVLLTPAGPCNGLAVTAREAGSFVVEELSDGSSDAEFDWLLIARKPAALGAGDVAELPDALPEIAASPPPEG